MADAVAGSRDDYASGAKQTIDSVFKLRTEELLNVLEHQE
jgi:hypothetical protein